MNVKHITRGFATALVLAGLIAIGADAQQVTKKPGSVGGSDTQVQFNDNGTLSGDAGMVYDKTNDHLTIAGTIKRTSSTWIDSGGVRFGSAMLVKWSQAFSDPNDVIDTGLGRNAAGVLEINNGSAGTFRDLKTRQTQTAAVAVASLQTCNAAAKGTRSFVTDANATTFLSTVAGGGANNVPVVCDGTNWVIG